MRARRTSVYPHGAEPSYANGKARGETTPQAWCGFRCKKTKQNKNNFDEDTHQFLHLHLYPITGAVPQPSHVIPLCLPYLDASIASSLAGAAFAFACAALASASRFMIAARRCSSVSAEGSAVGTQENSDMMMGGCFLLAARERQQPPYDNIRGRAQGRFERRCRSSSLAAEAAGGASQCSDAPPPEPGGGPRAQSPRFHGGAGGGGAPASKCARVCRTERERERINTLTSMYLFCDLCKSVHVGACVRGVPHRKRPQLPGCSSA